MNHLNCEYVREVLPDVLHGNAEARTVAAVREHLTECADCRAEFALIEGLKQAPVSVPAGLHERVLGALAARPRTRRLSPRHVALAAMLAAALIGGPVLFERLRPPGATPEGPTSGGLGVVTVEAAMVTGAGSLQDLTVEELEQLLGEIES
jgi:hypothetical protein